MKKVLIFILFLSLVFLFLFNNPNFDFNNFINKIIVKKQLFENITNENSSNENKTNKNKISKKKEFTIIGVGDIMLGSNYPSENLLPKNDINILQNTKNILQNADITVGNLEGTLFDSGGTPKKCNNPAVCYVFRTPRKYGKYLKEAGFDYLSIANNHSNDFGETGINQTMANLDNLDIKYSGIKNTVESTILEKDGKKFGFVSFAPNSATVNLNDYENVKKLITSVKAKVDILIVMFHGGAEGAIAEHILRKNEIFHGENRGNVYEFAHLAIDSGADIIFGQGPHVTRAIELYKNKFISYSAGNFATYGKISIYGSAGIAPIFKIKIDDNGNFISGEIIPIKQTYQSNGPFVDTNKSVIQKIISLNRSDFPEGNSLSITPDGKITKTF